MVMALNALDSRAPLLRNGGIVRFTGDGSTITFHIPHGLGTEPQIAIVGKASPNLPDIDYWTKDNEKISITFKQAPPSGDFYLHWLALTFTS